MPTSTRRRMRAAMVGAVAAVLVIPTAATGAPATPGAPGIGDPYFPTDGNGGYDVSTYDINVDFAPADKILTGTTTVVARATQDLSTFNLDLELKASQVTVNGQSATITQDKGELTVRPKKWLRAGAPFTAVVKYAGNAIDPEESRWIPTPTGAFITGQRSIARWWYPNNDHPRDKAKHTVTATVPAGLQAISNGLPVGKPTTSANKTTWKWKSAHQQATYLSTLAIGKYDITTTNSPLGIPSIVAIEQGAKYADNAKKSMARTGLITRWLQNQFGTYQFEAIGGIVPNSGIGWAMEAQTRPVYGPAWFEEGVDDSVVVHEMAHQWFGNSVSPYNWREYWLNEGPAQYSEWMWSEQQGLGDAQDIFDTTYASFPADDRFWKSAIGNPGAERPMPSAVYDRGAMTLQALRNRIGDPDFTRLLRNWNASHANGNGTGEEFTALAKQISGKNLDSFFTAWLYTASRPEATPENGFPVNSAARKGTKPNVPKSYEQISRDKNTHNQP